MSIDDKLFEEYSLQTTKEIANTAIFGSEIILYRAPRIIKKQEEKMLILESHHNNPLGGHIGQHRLYLKLREVYKWPKMKDEIKEFVRKCEKCQINK